MGCLPFVLGALTGGFVAAVTARSVRWYLVVLGSLVGGALTFVALVVFRVLSWERQHPLLKQMYKLKHLRLRDEDTDYEFLALGQAIVRTYLPPNESEPLLLRLDAAEERVKTCSGSTHEEPSPGGRVRS